MPLALAQHSFPAPPSLSQHLFGEHVRCNRLPLPCFGSSRGRLIDPHRRHYASVFVFAHFSWGFLFSAEGES